MVVFRIDSEIQRECAIGLEADFEQKEFSSDAALHTRNNTIVTSSNANFRSVFDIIRRRVAVLAVAMAIASKYSAQKINNVFSDKLASELLSPLYYLVCCAASDPNFFSSNRP